MRGAAFLMVMVFTAGCGKPFFLVTQSRVALDTPIVMNGRFVQETPPVSEGGPVVAMPVGGVCLEAGGPRIALVDVDGLLLNADLTGPFSLGENPVALFREKLDAIAADPDVAAVVVRINTPGGGVTATDIMWHDLQAFRCRTGRPVVACLLDLGTGGGYYLATASDLIIAHPTTITGGIGVVLNLYNLQDTMAYFNVISQIIKAGPLIDMGTVTAALSDETRRLLQEMANEFQARFRRVVEQARPGVDPREGTTFDGRVFTAGQALERRLIDRIGYLDDALDAARQLAGTPGAPAVLFHRRNDPGRSVYAVTPNVPLQSTFLPVSVPGLERSRLPTFLYLWQPDPTLERFGGK
ncbi:MAG TPA: S49 family peptidase [Gemmataceae bacterium]|nr:S49 family peptidase [Gemmataceae bacterium]